MNHRQDTFLTLLKLGTGVTCYAVHPGAVQTELGRHIKDTTNGMIDAFFRWSGQYFFKTPERGAQTTIYCATEPSLSEKTGRYYA